MTTRTILLAAVVACAAFAATVEETGRFLPLIHDGGGWTTEIKVVNLGSKPGTVAITFLNAKGNRERWAIRPDGAELFIAAGGTASVTTSGEGAVLERGFAEIVEYQDQPISASATLTRRESDGRIAERIRIPLSPANEKRSVMSLDLSHGDRVELVFVTRTTSTTLDVTFRNEAGEVVVSDVVNLDDGAQRFLDVAEHWPQLGRDFKGSLEWIVSFPNADRYEARTLSGAALVASPDGGVWAVLSGATLRQDQSTINPYQ
jgi:hypothetical protein